jgi:Flp pilus assembly protein TadG
MMSIDHGQCRGTALLEMVVVLPLFVILLGCIMDFGRSVNDRALLQEASKAGARAAAGEANTSQSAIEARARGVVGQFLTAAGYDPARCRVDVQQVSVLVGTTKVMPCVRVTVTADAGLSLAFILPDAVARVAESSTFRIERLPLQPAGG